MFMTKKEMAKDIAKIISVSFLVGYGIGGIARDIYSKSTGKCSCWSEHNERLHPPTTTIVLPIKEEEHV